MITKRKKKTRQRGSRTYGWGIKKHRGAGNRGGRGMAGTGKRADQKKTYIINTYGQNYFGKHGFKLPKKLRESTKTINVGDLSFDSHEINLQNLGYDKLLGKGKPNKKYIIHVKYYSAKAKQKIESAGGEIKKL